MTTTTTISYIIKNKNIRITMPLFSFIESGVGEERKTRAVPLDAVEHVDRHASPYVAQQSRSVPSGVQPVDNVVFFVFAVCLCALGVRQIAQQQQQQQQHQQQQ